ncbi:ATP-binding protein [Brachybacterium sp. GCM10030252]|uniref:sensor histidine kinase n=1 Tax=Brachybacterium sp. GCM10030252 TaxID=3273380 RepID=UPI0036193B6C
MPLQSLRESLAGAATGGWSVRTRVLSVVLAFMVVGLAVTGLLTYASQFGVLEDRVEAELEQELRELDLIANATEDDGSHVHTSVDSVLNAATESAAPSDNESVLAVIDGEPLYKPQAQDFDLVAEGPAESPTVLEDILAVHEPGRTVSTSLDVDGREVKALVASVQVAGDDSEGIFVVANDIGAQKQELWRSVATFSALSVVTLIVAGGVGYLVTGRLLRPLETLRAATEEITVDDLGRRVLVPEGQDDIAALARNFNRMLERIQAGFAEQRRFMSDVGHELRTPLTIVHGTLETADAEDPADVREAHEIAMDELDRMGRVVGDLSELAASTRPDYVRTRPVDLAAFARSALARMEHIADRDWVLDRAADVTADADEQRLTQAIVQLAANAARYSEEGSRVRFAVDRVLGPDGPEIHLSMQDEGVGIAEQDQQRIFERFARVDNDRGSGTGLGLPIVQAIAQGHGGDVRLSSQPGRGSTFTIVIPQHARPAGSGPGGPGEVEPGDTGPTGTGAGTQAPQTKGAGRR